MQRKIMGRTPRIARRRACVGQTTGQVIAIFGHEATHERTGGRSWRVTGYEVGTLIDDTNSYPFNRARNDAGFKRLNDAIASGEINGPWTFEPVPFEDDSTPPDSWAYELSSTYRIRVCGPLRSRQEITRSPRDVDSVITKSFERHDLECALMRRRKNDVGRRPITMGTQPVGSSHAPPITRCQSREPVLRHRRSQIVADSPLVFEELGGDHGTDRMAPAVLRSRRATSVTVEAP